MRIEAERVVEASSPIAALWRAVADTERTNRAVGLEPVHYRPEVGAGGSRYVGATVLGGFEIEYEELPTEWEAEKFFHIRRNIRTGPLESMSVRVEFTPRAGGHTVRVRLEMGVRWPTLEAPLTMRARQSVDQIGLEIERVDALLARGERATLPAPTRADELALGQALDALRARVPEQAALVDRLGELVRHGDDVEVARLRPYELADAWGVDRRALLTTMLEGVKAGLCDMRWEVVCPSCRGAVGQAPALSQVAEHGHCPLCELDFGLDAEDALEATFAPSRAVRKLVEGTFCLAGPSRLPHVVAQVILPENGVGELAVPREPGRYRVFVRGGASVPVVVEEGGSGRATITAATPGSGGELRMAPGARIAVHNAGLERHVKLERAGWPRQAATVRELSTLAAFRRDFSSDLLRPGATVKVARVALLFSDLTASTQLYATVGDAAAFRLVHDHFDLVFGLIERHGGAVVKTIGDAVMAVFVDDLGAVSAGRAILEAFEGFRREHPHRELTHIKLGAHAGSCYVVTANEVLDYFGQTVNIAARLQAQADSGELVVAETLADLATGRGLLGAGEVRERYEAKLKGVEGTVRVARVRVV